MRFMDLAIDARLTGDTLSSGVVAGSTTTVLQLAAGQATKWAARDIVNIASSGAANKWAVSILSVNTGLDRVTVDRTLPAVLESGATIGGGFQEWVRPATGSEKLLYHEPWPSDAPVRALLRDDTSPRCAVILSEVGGVERMLMGRQQERYRIRVFGRVRVWVDGLAARIIKLLDARKTGYTTVTTVKVWESEIGSVTAPPNEIAVERMIPRRLVHAPVHA